MAISTDTPDSASGAAPEVQPDPNYIPTIDIAPYLSDPSSPEAAAVVEAMRVACTTSGFFSVVGHGISGDLQDAVLNAAKLIFDLPPDQKMALKAPGLLRNRGYEVIGNQILQEGTLPDFREGYYVSKHIPPPDPRVEQQPVFVGANIFPASLPASLVKDPAERYYNETFALACKVLGIIARGMPYGDGVFDDFVRDEEGVTHPICAMRLLHYPPQRSDDARQMGAGAHTDFGAVTLLLQDDAGGLEVFNPLSGGWIPVPPSRRHAEYAGSRGYVVNVGDMLSVWTKGVYRSTLHRVVNKTSLDRYSVPFFFDGNADVELKPLDGSEPEKGREGLTVVGHMLERFDTTYNKLMKGTEKGEGK